MITSVSNLQIPNNVKKIIMPIKIKKSTQIKIKTAKQVYRITIKAKTTFLQT